MMRNTALFIGVGLIFGGVEAFAAINCATLPSCATLGYTETAGTCRAKFNVCPFDATKVTCINDGPHIGDLKYSLYSANHDGWLLCNGGQYSQTTYSKLYNVIKTNFCTVRSGGCSSGNFAVPDYRGFFLRGYYYPSTTTSYSTYSGSWNYSTTSPQKEQLPNITGNFGHVDDGTTWGSGALSSAWVGGYDAKSGGSGDGRRIDFNAANSNSIYSGSHVIPANYGAYIYIYAGQ